MARILRRKDERKSLWQRFVDVAWTDVSAIARSTQIQTSLEQLEEILIEADFGVATSMRLVEDVERKSRRGTLRNAEDFRAALEEGVASALGADADDTSMHFSPEKPTVVLVIGVNGAGKTTFIGKLGALMAVRGRKTLVGAADT